jgi:hypothetical protein
MAIVAHPDYDHGASHKPSKPGAQQRGKLSTQPQLLSVADVAAAEQLPHLQQAITAVQSVQQLFQAHDKYRQTTRTEVAACADAIVVCPCILCTFRFRGIVVVLSGQSGCRQHCDYHSSLLCYIDSSELAARG